MGMGWTLWAGTKKATHTTDKGEVQMGQAENGVWQGQGIHLVKTS